METDPTPTNEEIRPSTPQSTLEIVSSEAKDTIELEQAPTTEKRKREDENENGNPSKPEADSVRHPLWKTSLCSFFRRPPGGECSHGDTCRYAHGEAELRPRPDNSWDPTSDRAKKVQKTKGYKPDSDDDEAVEEDLIGEDGDDDTSLDKCLVGVPRNWGSDTLKKFLDDQGVLYKAAKKKKRMSVGFVVFEDVEQVKSAVKVLRKKSTSGGKHIMVANATRRSNDKNNEDLGVTRGLVPTKKSAREAVTPLADMPYSDQLEHKKNSLVQILKRLTRNAHKACPDGVPLPEWILKAREIGNLPCTLEGILESPVVDGYRNKCEFSVGYSLQGKQIVGYNLGNFSEGMTAVEEPINCPNVSRIACKYALIFQDFLQSSVFPVWDRINNSGFWRQFTVREGRHPGQAAGAENLETQIAEVMLIVQVCSSGVDEEQMKVEFKRMAQALALGAASSSPPLPLSLLVVQDHKGISNAAPADCPLLSIPIPEVEGHSFPVQSDATEARMHDYISNLKFSISPTAFFQVNTLAAERLYSLAGDWAELTSDTLLFDVCCGTGTIGLTLAHRVGMVIGIEMNESAVSDAERNAQINGINNCKFVCGKAEDVMGTLLKDYLGMPEQQSDMVENNERDEDVNANHDTENETPVPDAGVSVDTDASDAKDEMEILLTDGSKAPDATPNFDEERRTDSKKENTSQYTEVSGDANDEVSQVNTESLNLVEGNLANEEEGKGSPPFCQFKDVVAIVDPPRVGLHPIVIKALRTHPRIRRLVYISCNPESLVANAIELCTPTSDKLEKSKGNRGWRKMSSAGLARQRTKSMPISEPFRPVKAMAVDLFPHTPHCEMVMLLER